MNYSWKDIYAQAERFHKASEILNQKDEDCKIVSFTNAAFAIELYCKALYCKLNGKAPYQNHNIIDIFNSFTIALQNKIQDDYNYELSKRGDSLSKQVEFLKIKVPDFSTDFKWNLVQIKSAFLRFRYVYEKGNSAVIMFYPELRKTFLNQLNT